MNISNNVSSTTNRSHKLRMDHAEWAWLNDYQTCTIVQLLNLLALELVAICRCQHAVTVVRYIVTATHLLLMSILHAHGTRQTLLAFALMLHFDLKQKKYNCSVQGLSLNKPSRHCKPRF